MHALQRTAWDRQIARLGGAGTEDSRVKFFQEFFCGIILSDLGLGEEL
jgi:chromosome condensin MukBEF ATPase and DNA-binding subunit MukB